MLAAAMATPPTIGLGRPTPTGPSSGPSSAMRAAVADTTASGLAGCGVATRIRSLVRTPLRESTVAALIPLPPMSTPIEPSHAASLS